MASRFASVSSEEINYLAENAKNTNTEKSTNIWLNVFKAWATVRGKDVNFENYTDAEKLDKTLSQFYSEVRKQNGEEYEPDCLRVMQGAFQRHLNNNQSKFNILSDLWFSNSRNVLEGKARKLRAEGMGKRPNASHALSKADEQILWQCDKLGDSTPTTLVRTMWFNNTQYFGLRGVHRNTLP